MKKIYFLLCILFSLNLSAQETTNQFSLNFLIPSAEYEVALSENTSIDAIIGIGAGYHKSGFDDSSEFGIFPQFEAQYRWYYNFAKRQRKGKKVSENSANYIAAVGILAGGDPLIGDMELNNDYVGFVGPAWGLQRIYNGNFKLNLNLGMGLGFNDLGDQYLSPLIDIQLGFKLGK